ncbi:unnamed protein product [Candidula unifasciata]|uniref:15-oxoprostaglandin 13-reductase n=1 Tax=Candidula unifasciata TaxID=100452 RepID=A0A8S3ZKX4_9EUPU|nr:unnamed protein product [Candidula unifasciata]
MEKKNFHVVLKSRPGEDNEPSESNFSFEEVPFPPEPPKDGEVLIRNEYLSLDPALRCAMNRDTGVSYLKAWEIGETLSGFGGVGTIVSSGDPNYIPGDLVTAFYHWPWKVYFIISSSSVRKIPVEISAISPTICLNLTGLTGLTAYLGVREKAHVIKGANQTMVVSGAAGATGSVAGQVAKAEGCDKVVGICGSDTKCQILTEELGFHAAINYKTESVTARLQQICPEGVDIYFDNVGGSISDEVIRLMNPDSHVVLCGQISLYNKNVPYPPPLSEEISAILKERNITRERFLVLNYADKFDSSVEELLKLIVAGKIKAKETVEMGLANVGRAFVSMMTGGNIGKQLVKVTEQ